jgi:hypothetical protein
MQGSAASTCARAQYPHSLKRRLAKEFPRFPELPAEVQIMIWKEVMKAESSEPRLISLDIEADISQKGLPLYHLDIIVRRPQASLFYASYMSRTLLLKQIPSLFSQGCGYPLISANLSVDTIHFGPHFEMWQLRAFASAIGPDKTKHVRFLALEYQVKIKKVISDAYEYALSHGLEIFQLFENLEKLTFIPHDPGNGSENIKSRKLKIVPWTSRPRNVDIDEYHWSIDTYSGNENWSTFAGRATYSVKFLLHDRALWIRDSNWKKPMDWDPPVEFMELVSSC